jgi:hypothetical protein
MWSSTCLHGHLSHPHGQVEAWRGRKEVEEVEVREWRFGKEVEEVEVRE